MVPTYPDCRLSETGEKIPLRYICPFRSSVRQNCSICSCSMKRNLSVLSRPMRNTLRTPMDVWHLYYRLPIGHSNPNLHTHTHGQLLLPYMQPFCHMPVPSRYRYPEQQPPKDL